MFVWCSNFDLDLKLSSRITESHALPALPSLIHIFCEIELQRELGGKSPGNKYSEAGCALLATHVKFREGSFVRMMGRGNGGKCALSLFSIAI